MALHLHGSALLVPASFWPLPHRPTWPGPVPPSAAPGPTGRSVPDPGRAAGLAGIAAGETIGDPEPLNPAGGGTSNKVGKDPHIYLPVQVSAEAGGQGRGLGWTEGCPAGEGPASAQKGPWAGGARGGHSSHAGGDGEMPINRGESLGAGTAPLKFPWKSPLQRIKSGFAPEGFATVRGMRQSLIPGCQYRGWE